MKTKPKRELTLGDLISASYELWGTGKAERMVRLAIFARLVRIRA
jgi:hypothetical protein